jgi:SAM-dependent methyltransferase
VYRRSRAQARRRRAAPDDGLVRLGYAAGSITHQKDFAVAADAIAATLRARPACRLVLFREPVRDHRLVDIGEFPAFADLAGQIEWRDLVKLAELPGEIARFDVNLVPLEVGNPFCEAKSELKFFEAALLDVCTLASPTQPLRDAIRHERSGVLASGADDWRRQLLRLVDEPDWRRGLARAARRDALATFGPSRAAERMASVLDQLDGGRRAAAAFAREVAAKPTAIEMVIPHTDTVFASDRQGEAAVTVVMPLYNYAGYVVEALESVRAQTLPALDLIVVDDASTDDSLAVATRWARANAARFNRVLVLRNRANAGLGPTRNAGFDAAETLRVLPLDADNRLLPACCETLLRAAEASAAHYVYPAIRKFGATSEVIGTWGYDAKRLAGTPFVDAMALVEVAAWAAAGGYRDMRLGWEDYDLWCRFAEHGFWGEGVAEVLAEYRAHAGSMLRTTTDTDDNKRRLLDSFERRHPWVRVVDRPEWREAAPPPPAPAIQGRAPDRLDRLLPILRCPTTRLPLRRDGDWLVADGGGPRWPIVAGRAALFPGMPAPRVHPDSHVSNPLPDSARAVIRDADGLVLNLSAGGTETDDPNVVEAEAAIFRHTAVVADSHTLPFVDGAFAAVVVMNAFEHYRDPPLAAREILRVLRPGGTLLVRTAFLQPLHEAPWHFYNCTRYGLEQWFADFETARLHVSDNFTPSYTVSWLLSEAEEALRAGVSPEAAEAFARAPVGTFVRFWRDEGTRRDPLWANFARLPQPAQERIAAGFEYVGVKPTPATPAPSAGR